MIPCCVICSAVTISVPSTERVFCGNNTTMNFLSSRKAHGDRGPCTISCEGAVRSCKRRSILDAYLKQWYSPLRKYCDVKVDTSLAQKRDGRSALLHNKYPFNPLEWDYGEQRETWTWKHSGLFFLTELSFTNTLRCLIQTVAVSLRKLQSTPGSAPAEYDVMLHSCAGWNSWVRSSARRTAEKEKRKRDAVYFHCLCVNHIENNINDAYIKIS